MKKTIVWSTIGLLLIIFVILNTKVVTTVRLETVDALNTESSPENFKFRNKELIQDVKDKNLIDIKYDLKRGADVNCQDTFKGSPLFYAVTGNDYSIVDYLLKHNADVNFLYGNDETNLLQVAIEYYGTFYFSTDIIMLLTTSGIKINHQDKYGNTALGDACRSYAVDGNIIKYLIRNGANMNVKNNYGLSPYSMSVKNKILPLKSLLDSLK